MQKFTLTTLFCLSFYLVQAQGFIFLGAPQLDDQGNRMILTQDGGYITVGNTGANSVIYRTDCLGNLVAKLEKALPEGPTFFYDVIELADGNLLAVGKVISVNPPIATRFFILKATPMLTEISSNIFFVSGNAASANSVAQTGPDEILVWGEMAGAAPNYADVVVQKVDLNTLQPIDAPTVFDEGVDFAGRITPTADGNFVLTGSSVSGDIFNANAMLGNAIQVYKVDKNGAPIWHAAVRDTFLGQYGYAHSCGAVQASQSGRLMVGGNIFNTTAQKQDAIFILLDNDGAVLDTAFSDAPENQLMHAIVENLAAPNLFAMIGDTDGSPLGVPAFYIAQGYDFGGQLLAIPPLIDLNNPVSLRDAAQVDPGRFAIMGTYPESPGQTLTSVVVTTPAVTAGVVYQNCALAATLNSPASAYQWVREGVAIPGATQGVYFPTEPGLYQVQVLDTKGCYGISDTFRVNAATAGFTFDLNNLTATFSNTSIGASTYQWNFGDGTTSNQANPSHTYAADGVYEVTLIAKTACQGNFSDTISQQIGVVANVEPSDIKYSLAPNPSSGIFTLEVYFQSGQNAQYLLTSPMGQVLAQETLPIQNGRWSRQFDLSGRPAGVYALRISNGEKIVVEKVVKY